MLEEFISVALEAFNNANGNVDKFELELRRKLMVYNNLLTPQKVQNTSVTPKFEQVVNSLDINDPIFKELENMDINSMNDEQIMAIAQKMGLMTNSQEESFDE
jgi:hypothetical protein